MENNRGAVTHFTGIIRIVAFVVLIAIMAFFAIRWIRSSQRVDDGKQGASSQERAGNTDSGVTTDGGGEGIVSEPERDTEDTTTQTEEQQTNTAVTSEIPQVGAEDVLLSTITLSILAYAVVRYARSYDEKQLLRLQ